MRDQQFIKQGFLLLFMISYGQRSKVIDRSQNYDKEDNIQNDQDEKKKKRKYSPQSITIQKITFDNLKEICVCINEHLRRLEAIIECVNYCKNVLIKQLHTDIRKNAFKVDLCSIMHFIKIVRNILEKQICNDLNGKYPSLIEQEFHIIFFELTTIYCAYIAQGVIE